MHFSTLLAQTGVPDDLMETIDALMVAKAASSEMGEGMVPPKIRAFVRDEIERAEQHLRKPPPVPRKTRSLADGCFRDIVRHWGGPRM